jgi:hypothetical protein
VPRALLAALLLLFAAGAAGATMAVSIVTTGKLLVALVNLKGSRALFRAAVERKLAFRVSVPERGDYVLVLSNRDGADTVEVQAQIHAVAARPPRDYSPRPEKASMSPRLSSI